MEAILTFYGRLYLFFSTKDSNTAKTIRSISPSVESFERTLNNSGVYFKVKEVK